MLKPDQKVLMRWSTKNKKRLVSLGYVFTKMGDDVYVDIAHVTPNSHYKVVVICDYCGREFEMTMSNYSKSAKDRDKVACGNCRTIKTRERLVERYGVVAALQKQEFKEKAVNTNIERYGCENPTQNKGIREKQIKTLIERYGVDTPSRLPQYLEGIKNYDRKKAQENYVKTCLEKYGVDNTAKLQSVKDKAFVTCVKKYGGGSSQCSEEVRMKSLKTLSSNGAVPTSRAELKMVETIKAIYGEENCFPQYPLGRISMDCLLIVGDTKIDVEYDGKFWHDNKQDYDTRRDFYCIHRGYKVLRFSSKYNTPTEEQIKNGVHYLVNSEHNSVKFDI